MSGDWNLSFISEENYIRHVKEFYLSVSDNHRPTDLKELNRNILDPIKMTFAYFVSGASPRELISNEVVRQEDKTINNKIGYFHQNIFKYIEGWVVPQQGFDLVNSERHIFVELKNKHNTMNSSSSQKTYIRMQNKILQDDQARCFLAEVIAPRSRDEAWRISLDGRSLCHNSIRRISIDRLYEIATGETEAFRQLIEWLPITLLKLSTGQIALKSLEDLVALILNENSSFFKGLYNMAFNSYLGFDTLNFKGAEELPADFH